MNSPINPKYIEGLSIKAGLFENMSHCDLLDILCVNFPSHILNLFTKAFHNCYKCGSQTPCPLRLLPLLIAKLLFEQKIRVGFAETLSALRSHPFKQDEL